MLKIHTHLQIGSSLFHSFLTSSIVCHAILLIVSIHSIRWCHSAFCKNLFLFSFRQSCPSSSHILLLIRTVLLCCHRRWLSFPCIGFPVTSLWNKLNRAIIYFSSIPFSFFNLTNFITITFANSLLSFTSFTPFPLQNYIHRRIKHWI